MRASELADMLSGTLAGPGDPEIATVAPLDEACEGQVAFLHNSKYRKQLAISKASCIVLRERDIPEERTFAAIVLPNPHRAMADAVDILYPEKTPLAGIHPTAMIDPTATIGKGVSVEAHVFIGPGSVIGNNCRVYQGCVLMSDVHIGPKCALYPNVAIYPKTWLGEGTIIHSNTVLGSDGFGFAPTGEDILKIRQVGKLIIESDVEIGACCTLDRGSFTETRIGRGTKIDNMVHIGHNCRIGENCLIAAQTGLAGSTIIGNRVIIAGQVGFGGHQKIGDDSIFFAKSGINGDVEPGSQYFGYPAKDRLKTHRENVYISKLGELFKRVKELEKQLDVNRRR